jgi:2,4-dienoyl-CoA reductase-like NADH-dependent reductase (Old Yellow Enzyme family)
MSHYFKFRSIHDLEQANSHLGLDLRFTDDLTPLFQPVRIGPLKAGNAMCIQPMEGCDGTLDGRPDELTLRRYQRFGAGGAKLIWFEASAVVDEGRANSRQLFLNENTALDFERVLRACRESHRAAFGSDDELVIGVQLTHSGRYSYRRPQIAFHDPLLDPRTIVNSSTCETVTSDFPIIEDDALGKLVDYYVAAARIALRIGFQFVDIKQCHRYLLNELLAAKTRPGRYGGSLENRTRLASEIFTAIRSETPQLVLASRLNVYDGIPFRKRVGDDVGEPCVWTAPVQSAWGTSESDPLQPDLSEPKAWIGRMIELGVELINVSMGNPYATPHLVRPFEYPPPDGYETPEHPLVGVDRHFRLTEELQKTFPSLPIVGSGYSYLQEFLFNAGAANLRDHRATFVGVGRAALPQPDFAKQLLENGHLDRRRVCRTFSYCTALMRSKKHPLGQYPTGCPPFDKEVYGPIWGDARNSK